MEAGLRLLVSAALFGVIAGVLLAVDGPQESLETQLWVLAFAAAVPGGFVVGGHAVRRLDGPGEAITCVSAGLWLMATSLFLLRAGGPSIGAYLFLTLVSLTTLALPWLVAGRAKVAWHSLVGFTGAGAAVVIAAQFMPTQGLTVGGASAALALAVLGTVLIATVEPKGSRIRVALDATVVILIVLVVAQFPALQSVQMLQLHENFFLGPVNDISHGRAMLDGAWSQYGVAVFYVLKLWFWFVPLGYGGLSLLLVVATVGYFLVFYSLLRLGGASVPLAAVAVAVSVCGQILGSSTAYVGFPSIGPLRFGLPLAVIGLAVIAARRPAPARWLEWLQLLVVAVSAVWSFETFVYCAATFLGIHLISAIARGPGWLRIFLRDVIRMVASACVAVIALSALTAVASGNIDWGPYFDFLLLYSVDGYSTIPMQWFSPGGAAAVVVFASAVSLLWFAALRPRAIKGPTLVAVAGFTGAAAAEFTYYLGRSDLNNLPNVIPPIIAIAALWIVVLMDGERRRTTTALVATSAILLAGGAVVTQAWPTARLRWADTAFALITPGGSGSLRNGVTRYLRAPVLNPLAPEGVSMLNRNFAQGEPAPVILEPDLTTEVLVRSGRRNSLAMGHPLEDDAVKSLWPRAVASARALRAGDLVLVGRPECTVTGSQAPGCITFANIQRAVLEVLKRRFDFQTVDSSPNGLRVVRLKPKRDLAN